MLRRVLSPKDMEETRYSVQYILGWNKQNFKPFCNTELENTAVVKRPFTKPKHHYQFTQPHATITVYRNYMEKLLAYLRNRANRLLTKSNTVGLRNLIIVELSALNGFRTSEVKTVQVEDIDFHDLIIFVLDSKKHVYIPVELDPMLALDLEEYIRLNKLTSGYILQKTKAGRKATKPSPLFTSKTIEQVWTTPCKRLGIPIMKPTIGRAYEACVMHFEEDTPTIDIQKHLRHTNIGTTEVYLSMLDDFNGRHQRFLARRRARYAKMKDKVWVKI